MSRHLLLVAIVLAVVTFSAPTSSPDETIPQLEEVDAVASNPIAALKSQFLQIQSQVKEGMKITPQVKVTIDAMTALITDHIEPAIKAAHDEDQKLINSKMHEISSWNNDNQLIINNLNSRAVEIRAAIDRANQYAQNLASAAHSFQNGLDKYEHDVKAKTDKCCDYQKASVPDVEYTPAYAVCDYAVHSARACVAAAQEAKNNEIVQKFKDGFALYLRLKQECADLTAVLPGSRSQMESSDKTCDDTAAQMNAEIAIVNRDLPVLHSEWSTAEAAYHARFATLKAEYHAVEATVKAQEADRQREWDATQEIKCMLINYREGGSFDGASLSTCKGNINHLHLVITYPEMVPETVWNLGPFTPISWNRADEDTCRKNENADENAACNIPSGKALPACENHKIDEPAKKECQSPFVADAAQKAPHNNWLGTCSDRLPQTVVFHPEDPFWQCMGKKNPEYAKANIPYAGCGYAVGYAGYKWLSGWSADEPALVYKPVGKGTLFLADFDWQDNEPLGVQRGLDPLTKFAFECMMNYAGIQCDGTYSKTGRTKLAVCGYSSYHMAESDLAGNFDDAVDQNNCSFDDKYDTVFITRGGIHSVDANKMKAYLNNGGIVVTEHSASSGAHAKASLLEVFVDQMNEVDTLSTPN